MPARARLAALLLPLPLLAACSVRRMALDGLSDALSGSTATFAREDDPELVREALPFALKAIEALLLEDPRNTTLLASASGAFGLYAYAFLQLDAELLQSSDYGRARQLEARALALYLRARDYALRGLELRHAELGARLRREPERAAAELGAEDLRLAYWAGGTWGLAIALAKDQPALAADVDAVRALLRRCLVLDEALPADSPGRLEPGAVHEALISIEALPRAMGGSPERAREHYLRALELSGGRRASMHVTLAENLCVPAQDRAEFERLLALALAVDLDAAPDSRLSNRIAQTRARHLLSTIDDLFLPPLD